MKKIFFGMMALVAMVATSCQQDVDLDQQVNLGETATVSFNLATPQIATKAKFSEGALATHLQYAVYDANQNILSGFTVTNGTINGGSTTVEFQLTTGNTYYVLFWAAAPGAPYNVNLAAKSMEVSYDNAVSSDETRDAFYYYDDFTVEAGMAPISAELKRPFAQLNIGTSDLTASTNAGYEVTQAKVTVPVYTNLDFASGIATNEQVITFDYANVPTSQTFPVAGYQYLAMNYILMNKTQETVDVKFQYTDGTTAQAERTVGSVPVQRNHRTNLYGQLLTSNTKVNVEIKPAYDDPMHEADELQLAALNGGEITLTEDVVLNSPLNVQSNLTIDLNGKTIKGNWHKNNGAIIKNNGTLTIVGGTISSLGENGGSAIQNSGTMVVIDATLNGAVNANGSWPSYTVNNTGKLTLNDVVITSHHGAVASYGDGAVVTLNNSTIDMAGIPGFTSHGIYTYNNGKVVVNGGTYANKATDQNASGASVINGAVTVNSGDFSGRIENYYGTPVLKGGSYSVNPKSSFIADGYKAIENNGRYYVVAEDVDAVATTPAEVLSSMKVAGQTVCIKPTTDGSAHLLEGKMSLAEGVSLIGMGDEPVALFNDWGSNAFAKQAHFTNTTVENINFTNNLVIDAGIANGNVHFKNCVFGGDRAHQGVHFDSGNATIVFDNCTFVGRNMLGSSLTKVIFNDCTFLNKKSSLTGADKWTGVNMWGKYEFNNCVFDTEATCNVKTNGIEATFTNCKYVDNRNIEEVVNNYAGYPANIIIDGELLPTPVSTTEQLANALSEGGNIELKENVAIEKIDLTNLTNDIVIDANGKTITTSSNYGVQVKAGKNITLKNAKVEITVDGNYITYAAGFKVENGDYQGNTITLKDCEIRMHNTDWAYAVTMPASVKNLNLVIDGCTLEGAVAFQCWGDNNTITATNSHFICNYTTSAMYTSYCVALQGDGTNNSENNTLKISGCEFSYSGVDNFNSPIKAVYNSPNSINNTITVVDCTYDNKVIAY